MEGCFIKTSCRRVMVNQVQSEVKYCLTSSKLDVFWNLAGEVHSMGPTVYVFLFL